jgi:purine-binding chemotaxis protein CheW
LDTTSQSLPSRYAGTHHTLPFVAFALGDAEYGIEVRHVQELRSYATVTPIDDGPDYLIGATDLRGVIVPVVDLRVRYDLCAPAYNQFTVVMVLTVAGRTVGMLVDRVSEVTALSAGEIGPAPSQNTALDARYIAGIGTLGARKLLLVDIEKLMAGMEIGLPDMAEA